MPSSPDARPPAAEPSPDDYAAAVAELLARPSRPPGLGLERATTLVELLGRPDQAFPSIHVAGGDGKRAVARMVAALLGALDLNAGCYAASHAQDVRERIRVGEEPLDRDGLVERMAEVAPFLAEVDARHPEPLSPFEAVTALAFAHFADAPVDVGVFEGSASGVDATDLVRAEVVVLAPVDGGSQGAGESAAALAEERAAAVEEGGVVVTGPQPPEVSEAIERACQRRQARLVALSEETAVGDRRLAVGGQHLDLRGQTGEFDEVYVPLHGRAQAVNAALALAAVEGFLGFAGGLDADLVREGFAAVRVPGRIEVVRRTDASTVVLDSAATPAAAAALAEALREEFAFRHRVLVVGPTGDEDAGLLEPLLDLAEHVVVAPAGPRAADTDRYAADVERLAATVDASGTTVETAGDVESALELASGLAGAEDAVVVVGSLEAAGAARVALGLGVA